MTLRPLRLLRLLPVLMVAGTVLALALPAVGAAATAGLGEDRGIVQSIDAARIELRALDGSVASFAISPATRVKLNGRRATLTAIRPGYVATVTHDGGNAAVVIRVVGRPVIIIRRGVVASLGKGAITLYTPEGTATIPLDVGTVFRFRGLPGAWSQARPGALVVVRYRDGETARTVNVLKRARA
ncbi:MAG: hypothetical protein EXQ81_06945 [Thermoleophilia bacterium]|nr:hypothetical protein [Thermoleophilia bacterium]